MKVINIGRDPECDIVLEDANVSRRHAVIRLFPSGRIEIIDYSRNGTSVNGKRLPAEKLTRISRKDSVTFAGVQALDWNQVPDISRPVRLAVIILIAIIALIALTFGGIAIYNAVVDHKTAEEIEQMESQGTLVTTPVDTGTVAAPSADDAVKEEETVNLDAKLNLPAPKPKAPAADKKAAKADKKGDKKQPEAAAKTEEQPKQEAPKEETKKQTGKRRFK